MMTNVLQHVAEPCISLVHGLVISHDTNIEGSRCDPTNSENNYARSKCLVNFILWL